MERISIFSLVYLTLKPSTRWRRNTWSFIIQILFFPIATTRPVKSGEKNVNLHSIWIKSRKKTQIHVETSTGRNLLRNSDFFLILYSQIRKHRQQQRQQENLNFYRTAVYTHCEHHNTICSSGDSDKHSEIFSSV